ncbi:MAG: IS3 family transposase [Flavisolibacter sp.]|nr:IS3 family transposase [Flavisolibacter sp.]
MFCSLSGYTRQAYYQHIHAIQKEALQAELLIQEVVCIRKTQKKVGARKLLVMMEGFLKTHYITIGRDAFFELLREQGLLIRKTKRSKPQTTWSHHWLKKYSNLVRDFIPTAANQLWVSDITYIHVGASFAYLSLITDAYSRKVVGFYLSEDLSAKGCIAALKMALNDKGAIEKLIHHSDRGVQYCSADYVALLEKRSINISMTQNSDPLENAIAERVNGILKEELLEEVYASFNEARQAVAIAISTYNYQRLHASIDMLTPAEAHLKTGILKRHWKNYSNSTTKQKEVAMAAS